jgi:hypothetical protein
LSAPSFFLAIALAATSAAVPRAILPLPATMGSYANAVAWESPQTLLIATERGVFRFSIGDRKATLLLSGAPLPDGLPEPSAIATDGATLVAASMRSYGSFSLRLRDQKRLIAQRTLKLLDVAVHGSRACVIGCATSGEPGTSTALAFCGAINDGWGDYKPLHRLRSGEEARDVFAAAAWGISGSIAMGDDGSIAVVTAAEPGVYRYSPSGELLEVLGASLDQYVIRITPDVLTRFATDVLNRYRLLLNTQSLVDDLVITSRGPALVVRIAGVEKVRWALIWPLRNGGASPPLRLGIDRLGPYGHMRCAANGTQLACVGSKPPRKQDAVSASSERHPHLWLIELPN